MLIAATDDDFAVLISGRAPRDFRLPDSLLAPIEVLTMLRSLADTLRSGFTPAAWMIIEGDEIVGMFSVIRLPVDGAFDIGYGVAPTRAGRGYVTRALADLLAWARTDERINAVTAKTSVNNIASQIVLMRNGFVQTGPRLDAEDGDILGWKVLIRHED